MGIYLKRRLFCICIIAASGCFGFAHSSMGAITKSRMVWTCLLLQMKSVQRIHQNFPIASMNADIMAMAVNLHPLSIIICRHGEAGSAPTDEKRSLTDKVFLR